MTTIRAPWISAVPTPWARWQPGPVRFAEDCAVRDILSNGRLEMSVAVGYRRREAEGYGVDFSKRGSRTDEFLEIVQRLWAGEILTFEGKHFRLMNASIKPTPPRGRVPLYLGGFNDKAIERTAKFGDGYFGYVDVVDLYVEKLRACGKDPAIALFNGMRAKAPVDTSP